MPLDWFRRRAEGDPSLSRRSLLRLAAGGVAGLSLPHALAATGKAAKAKSVLVVLEQGGLSHIDTWDPKPLQVSEDRSPFAPIPTRVPGMRFTELLSRTALVADKLAVVRSMHHTKAGADGHPLGTQYALSGSHPAGGLLMPDIGSIVSHLLGSPCKYLPPYIMVPGNHEQAGMTRHGFLPAATKVFKTGGLDLDDPAWKLDGLSARAENRGARLAGRRGLQSALRDADDTGLSRFYDQAFDILASPKVGEAFDLRREPSRVRERYGRGHRGACYLMGRRLVEAGARFVTVDPRWPLTKETPRGRNLNWDHHDHIYAKDTCELRGAAGGGAGRYGIAHQVMMGSTDQAFSALVTDLHERGLLAETLVCFVTEFGRTPKVNRSKGRDHWTHAYSIVFAGAGVPGGQVIGRTDKEGGYVLDQAHTPEDYASTVYAKLGIDRDRPLLTPGDRPVYFGHAGEPIPEVM